MSGCSVPRQNHHLIWLPSVMCWQNRVGSSSSMMKISVCRFNARAPRTLIAAQEASSIFRRLSVFDNLDGGTANS
ncbi:hypothetical protein KCP76_06750 [Salmonella enterica subsp. enterica serovar Weltevreden]|nr:hypothetical protein KCP76_06750 [Salmonella enterica subsp. enterica serovar Weltevreden]